MMLRQQGETVRWDRLTGRTDYESEIFTCGHCQKNVFYRDPATGKALAPDVVDNQCWCCRQRLCQKCRGSACTPFMKRIEAEEERAYRQQQTMRCV